jgi:mRNA-degrading endonuclease RelE of RelBE toxin-antitoxin system
MMATVTITAEAQQQFFDLPVAIQARMEKIFVRLERWPAVSGAKALSGNLAGRYRIRTGDYRVQFQIIRGKPDDKVVIEKVGHRDGFYGD